jgi:hypothetical protein
MRSKIQCQLDSFWQHRKGRQSRTIWCMLIILSTALVNEDLDWIILDSSLDQYPHRLLACRFLNSSASMDGPSVVTGSFSV